MAPDLRGPKLGASSLYYSARLPIDNPPCPTSAGLGAPGQMDHACGFDRSELYSGEGPPNRRRGL
jgi:hypothetical protein